MEYFDFEDGNGGIGDTQRADVVLNANAVNEQSKAFFREICEKNGRQFIIISGCIFSKEAYAGGVNNISTTEGYIYNKALDSIIKVEAQNIIESDSEWFVFYLRNEVKNDNADGIRSYKDGANVNCWKQERYILKGISTGSPSNNEYAQFTFYIQDELEYYVNGKFEDYNDLINSPDYTLGTSGSIQLKKGSGVVSIKFSAQTLLSIGDQLTSHVFTLPSSMRPGIDVVTPYACWYSDSSNGNLAGVAIIKSTGEVTVQIAGGNTQVYCRFSFIL